MIEGLTILEETSTEAVLELRLDPKRSQLSQQ